MDPSGDAGKEARRRSEETASFANDENANDASSTRERSARSSRSSVCAIPSFARRRRACSCCRCSASRGWFATFWFGGRAFGSAPETSRRLAAPRSRSSHCCIGVRCVCHRGTSDEGCVGARRDLPASGPSPKSAGRARSPESTAAGTPVGRGGGTASREPPAPSPSDASRPSRNESVSEATSNLAAGTNPAWRDIAALHVRGSRVSRFQASRGVCLTHPRSGRRVACAGTPSRASRELRGRCEFGSGGTGTDVSVLRCVSLGVRF